MAPGAQAYAGPRPLDLLSVAIAGGVAAGVVHTAELLITTHVAHELVFFSRDFAWMAPIAYSLLFLLPALGLAALAYFVRRRWIFAATIFLISTLAIFGVLLPFSQIAHPASLLLAIGASTQIMRLAMASPDAWVRASKRLALGGIVAAIGWACISTIVRTDTERRSLAAFPPAAQGAPNVLLLVLDTVRATALGLYGGDPATSPALSRWAADGVQFEWAISVAPWTLPSHASMFTGRYTGEMSTGWRTALDERDSTLAELFLTRGYATGGFVGNMHYTSWESGLTRGFASYLDYRRSPLQLVRSSSYAQTRLFQDLVQAKSLRDVAKAILHPSLVIFTRHLYDHRSATQVTREFLDWQSRLGSRPFFAFLNFIDAHDPYTAPPAFHRFPPAGRFDDYQAAIAYIDSAIDSMLTSLRSRGVLENTIVIVTADHGEHFGEHGLNEHGNSLYLELLRVPLLIRFPSVVPAAVKVQQTISLRDLAATIVDLAQLKNARLPGRSLRATWSSPADSRVSPVFAQLNKLVSRQASFPPAPSDMSSLLDDSTHYISNPQGRAELYAYRRDPSESSNTAADSTASGRVSLWRQRVDSLIRAHHR